MSQSRRILAEPFAPSAEECLDRAALEALQGRRLQRLFEAVYGRSAFYTKKFQAAGLVSGDVRDLRDLASLPFTVKAELTGDQDEHRPWGTLLTEPIERYTRYCQTSSTTGRPLRWCDTNESWQWMVDCWKAVFRAAHIGAGDRVLFPFSFGPFLGFWTAFEAATQIGAHAIPAGGMSTHVRLALVDAIGATAICCTPTYALRLAEVAAAERRADDPPLAESAVRVLIVAGEPGGSIPATRGRIEATWGARVMDHHGLTETGPASFECWERPGGMHVLENEYIAEVLDPETGKPVADGQPGELVLTNLGRLASPVIRYRTGDLVTRRTGACACGRALAWLDGGILARADDMVAVRGVNVFPGAIEAVIRRFGEIAEFRSTVQHAGAMRTLAIDIEIADASVDAPHTAVRVSQEIREALGLTVPVRVVQPGTLPRFEMKARRFLVER